MQKNMSYVRVEHFVPSRERAVRRVRLRSWSGLQTRTFTYHRTWDVSLLAFRARRDGFARARRVLRRLLFYAIFQFTLSAFPGLMAERPRHDARGCALTGSLVTASRASPPRAGASPRRAGGTRAVDRGSRPLGRAGAAARPRHASARGHQLGTDRSSHGPRRASIHHVVRRAPALELRTQGARAPAGVPGDGERHGGRGVRGRQRGLKGAPPPSPTPPLAHAAPHYRRKRKEREAEGDTRLEPSV